MSQTSWASEVLAVNPTEYGQISDAKERLVEQNCISKTKSGLSTISKRSLETAQG